MFNKLRNFLLIRIRKCLIVILSYIRNVFWPKTKFIDFNIFLLFYIIAGLIQPILLIQYCLYYSNYIVNLGISDVMPHIFILVILFSIYLYVGKSLGKYKLTTLRLIICIFNIILHTECIIYLICLWYF